MSKRWNVVYEYSGEQKSRKHATYSGAVHEAVAIARIAGNRNVTVLRFDPDGLGWDIAGVVRVLTGQLQEPRLCLYQDLRTASQQAYDQAHEQVDTALRNRAPANGVRPRRGRWYLGRFGEGRTA